MAEPTVDPLPSAQEPPSLGDALEHCDTQADWHLGQIDAAIDGVLALLPSAGAIRDLPGAADSAESRRATANALRQARALIEGIRAHAQDLADKLDCSLEDARSAAGLGHRAQ